MRLIDADALIRSLIDYYNFYPVFVRRAIEKAPTIDAEPVVRCKDCKYSGMYCFGASPEPSLACLDIEEDGFVRMATAVDLNGFCSYGERKGETE